MDGSFSRSLLVRLNMPCTFVDYSVDFHLDTAGTSLYAEDREMGVR